MYEDITVTSQPLVTPLIQAGRNYQLVNDVSYIWENEIIVIKKGVVFDGASVPKILHWFIGPMDPRIIAASLLHDVLYEYPDLADKGTYFYDGKKTHKRFSKAEADMLFLAVNKSNNMDVFRRNLAYLAVAIFGARRDRGHTD